MLELKNYFDARAPISDEEWAQLSEHLIIKTFPKNSVILKQGEVENTISFVAKGIVRFYIPQNEEKETTFAIIFENELMCAYDSFLTRQPVDYCVETIIPTTILTFSYDVLQKLYKELPIANVLGRIASEEIYLIKAKRELTALKYSAQQRYLNLFNEKPRLIKEIPLKYLASYIGVTPQALSRIRRRITEPRFIAFSTYPDELCAKITLGMKYFGKPLRSVVVVGFVVLMQIGCRTQHVRSTQYSYKPPIDRQDGLKTEHLRNCGMDSARLIELTRKILADSFPNIHSLLIMKDNRLVYENYFAGYDQKNSKNLGYINHSTDDVHDCRSITKSVISACIGIALQKGLLPSIDEPIFNYFPQYACCTDSTKSTITIRHLLTMTSGLSWNEYTSYANPANSEFRMNLSLHPIKFILSRNSQYPPGTTWIYSGGNSQLLAEIIQKVSGVSVDSFARKTIFEPLGINHYEWERLFLKKSYVAAASGLRLTSRDMIKFGSIYLNNGLWNGERILATNWVDSSLAFQIKRTPLKHIKAGGYGFQFWNYSESINGKNYFISEAKGNGGNSIFICKELNLLVVITAGNYNQWAIKNNAHQALIQYIIPAINEM